MSVPSMSVDPTQFSLAAAAGNILQVNSHLRMTWH